MVCTTFMFAMFEWNERAGPTKPCAARQTFGFARTSNMTPLSLGRDDATLQGDRAFCRDHVSGCGLCRPLGRRFGFAEPRSVQTDTP